LSPNNLNRTNTLNALAGGLYSRTGLRACHLENPLARAFCALWTGERRLQSATLMAALLLLTALARVALAETEVSGEVSGEWTVEGSPYIVTDSTWVSGGQTLEIQPGVEVLFDENVGMWVFGQIRALGQEEDTIRFKARYDSTLWPGIKLIGQEEPQEFKYCVYSGAPDGIIMDDRVLLYIGFSIIIGIDHALSPLHGYGSDFMNITIENSIIMGRESIGPACFSNVKIYNSIISDGVYSEGGRLVIENSDIYGGIGMPDFTQIVDCNLLRALNDSLFHSIAVTGGTGCLRQCYIENEVRASGGRYIPFTIAGCEINAGVSGDGSITIDSTTIRGHLRLFAGTDSVMHSVVYGDMGILPDEGSFIKNCAIYGSANVSCFRGGDIIIDSCEFGYRQEDDYPMVLLGADGGDSIRFTRNIIHNVIHLRGGDNIQILNNSFYFDGTNRFPYAFCNVRDYSSLNIINNIFVCPTDTLDFIYNNHALEVEPLMKNNLFWGFGNIFYQGRYSFPIDSSNITADPLFASLDPFDPHLQENSPCIDAGDPNQLYDPDSTISDIGAHYYHHERSLVQNSVLAPQSPGFIRLWPSPTNGFIFVHNNSELSIRFHIFDVMGRDVTFFPEFLISPFANTTVNLSSLATGVYIYTASADLKTTSGILILQK